MKLSLSLTILVLFVVALSLVTSNGDFSAKAQVGEPGVPQIRQLFGGKIQQVHYCTCPSQLGTIWLQVGPPVAKSVLVIPLRSIQYAWWNYTVGTWTLGDAGPSQEACYDFIGKGCVAVRYGFPVLRIGTSPLSQEPVQAP